jgi:predicted nucleic acid-binding protein
MSVAVLDTTVLIHLFRKNPSAHTWIRSQQGTFSITSITWLEVMRGVPNKNVQQDALKLLSGFEMAYLTELDQVWAMQQVQDLRFSHNIGISDAFIAAVAHRL